MTEKKESAFYSHENIKNPFDRFSKNLTEFMKTNNITQTQLADKLNTTQATVSRWLSGAHQPNIDTFGRICIVFNISPNELIGYDEMSKEGAKQY